MILCNSSITLLNMLNRIILISLLSTTAWAESVSPKWDCGEPNWVTPPTLEDGIFNSTLTAQCTLSGGTPETLSRLAQFIRNDITTSGKLTVNAGPIEKTYEGLPAFEYDVTDDLKSEGSPASIRQELVFATDEKTRLIYKVNSKDVQGKGMASYLQKVDLLAEVLPTEQAGVFTFQMTNSVQVKRPWYALAFIFQSIAKQTAVEKFNKTKDRLISYLSPHL